jgi:ADP-glucose pyrophosphorylase
MTALTNKSASVEKAIIDSTVILETGSLIKYAKADAEKRVLMPARSGIS